MKTTAPSDVAIITVSYNSSAQLASFLNSAVMTVAFPEQITVVDNNSADIDVTEALTRKLGVRLLRLDTNVGYGSAVNKAVPGLPSSIQTLLVCNPDSELNPAAVSSLAEATQQEKIGVVGPRILEVDGSVYPSARSIPSIRNGIGHAFFANIWQGNPWTKKYLSEAHLQNSRVETGWVSGACLATSRELFESVGGFDDHYFMYFEDVDLGYRLGKLGYRNIYLPDISVTHIGGESTKSVKKEMLKVHHESAMRFIRAKYSGPLWAPLRWIIRLGLAVRLKIQAS
jgi:N-acetylglucosaminyl-diphospho-decaprenol L-rhamnosyltransferase